MGRPAGFTLVELLIVVAVIATLAALATPGLMRARGAGNEASAVGSVRTLIQGQTSFAATCGGGGYADTLAALATPPPGGRAFVGPDVAAGLKSGYLIANAGSGGVVLPAAQTCNTAADARGTYLVTATPISFGVTGHRSFGGDHRGAIYQDTTGAPLAAPLVAGGTVTVLQ